MRKSFAAAAAVIMLGLAGCGSDKSPVRVAESGEATPPAATSSPSPTEEPDLDQAWEDAVAFVTAINKDQGDAALALTDGSTWAFKYATHQKAMRTALSAAGQADTVPTEAVVSDKAAGTVTTRDVQNGQNVDTVFGNFVTDTNGKIAAFEVNGVPIAQRLWTQPAGAEQNGLTASLISAYKAGSGAVFAVVDITSAGAAVSANKASYVDGAHRQFETTYSGPQQIAPDATGSYIYVADGAEFGGRLTVEVYDAESYETAAEFVLPLV